MRDLSFPIIKGRINNGMASFMGALQNILLTRVQVSVQKFLSEMIKREPNSLSFAKSNDLFIAKSLPRRLWSTGMLCKLHTCRFGNFDVVAVLHVCSLNKQFSI